MKRLYPALFLLSGLLLFVDGCDDNQSIADWVPKPNDLELVPEPRVLEAVDTARKIVENDPESATAWGKLGHVYMAHDWHAEAIPCYQRATELEPESFRWLYFLGRSFKSDPAMAADVFARAIALDSTYAPAHVYFAESLKHLGRFSEAQRHYHRAAQLDPLNPYSELRLGQLALSAKRFKAARDHLQRSTELHPEQDKAHSALAQVFLALGDREAAARHAQAARQAGGYKEMNDALWWEVGAAGATAHWFGVRGSRYLRAGHYELAVAELAVAVSIEQEDPTFWLHYGTALINLERFDEAVDALERALAADRENKKKVGPAVMEPVLANLGVAHGSLGHLDVGINYLEKALTVNPASIEAMNNLAVMYRSHGVYSMQSRC
jgi:tetratricopeptide (TPR) repeat protein